MLRPGARLPLCLAVSLPLPKAHLQSPQTSSTSARNREDTQHPLLSHMKFTSPPPPGRPHRVLEHPAHALRWQHPFTADARRLRIVNLNWLHAIGTGQDVRPGAADEICTLAASRGQKGTSAHRVRCRCSLECSLSLSILTLRPCPAPAFGGVDAAGIVSLLPRPFGEKRIAKLVLRRSKLKHLMQGISPLAPLSLASTPPLFLIPNLNQACRDRPASVASRS
jgi:hypothetical protein